MKIEQNVFNSAFGDALDICWQSSLSHVPEGATLLAEVWIQLPQALWNSENEQGCTFIP